MVAYGKGTVEASCAFMIWREEKWIVMDQQASSTD